ncbi:TonB-dependent receptor [Glaciecola sp. 2405UD65-10]|uniref:TonB-dependent receptor n=1 Tax=Glaciecola sp. 2405UD65-10 TaxID=3397244 RepID=UPI003B5B0815
MAKVSCKVALVSAVVSSVLSTAHAQEIEEVVVTAQKREQSIMEVPATMDVISGAFLERTNTLELDDLSRVLPNVVIQEQAVSLPSFNVRGITDDTSSISTTPRISVYQDGIDISKKTVASAALFDVARVEVLKGPQPTLFGAAAANGAVSIISNLPSDQQEGKLKLGYNSEQGTELQVMFNQPLNDQHSFRVAALYREMDGVVKNNACGDNAYNTSGYVINHLGEEVPCTGNNDLNGVSVQAIRATLRSEFDKLEVITRVAYEYNDQPGISFKSGSVAPKDGDTSPYSNAELGLGPLLGIERTLASFDIAATYELNKEVSISADAYYKDVDLQEGFDADGSGLRIQDAYFENDAKLKGASARILYDNQKDFAGFIGVSTSNDESVLPYYVMVDPSVRGTFDAVLANLEAAFPNIPLNQNVATDASLADIESLRNNLVSFLFDENGNPVSIDGLPENLTQGPFVFEAEIDINSIVAEGTYDITNDLSLTAGVRYLDEKRFTRNFGAFEGEGNFTATLPRFALNYALNNDWTTYFNYAQGRRSPVVNSGAGGVDITKAEIVDSFDVGAKYQAGKITFTGALFTYSYQDYQQSFTDPNTLQSITVTVGDSRMSGLEATLNYMPSSTLMMTASLGLLDAKFADETSSGEAFEYAGNRFRLAPEVSGAFNINKIFNINEWELEADWLMSYQSEVFFESSNYPGLSQDAYWLVDASVKIKPSATSSYSVELYADNLFDEEFLIDAGNTGGGLGIPTFVRGMPQIYGLRFNLDF